MSYNICSHISLSLAFEKTLGTHYLHPLMETLAELSRKRPCLSTPLESAGLTDLPTHNCHHLSHIGDGSTCTFRVFSGTNLICTRGDFCLTWFSGKLLRGAEFFSGIRPFTPPEGDDYQCYLPPSRANHYSSCTVKELYNIRCDLMLSQEIIYLKHCISILCE